MTLLFDPVEKIQGVVNHLIQQDPQTLASIRALAGKIIAIEIIGPGVGIYIQPNEQGITLMSEFTGKPHVTIKARPATLIGLLLNRKNKVTKASPDMEIIGDVILAQEFQKILNNMDIDWEEHLSHWFGDTAAHKLGRIFRNSREYLKETRNTIGMDISEYLRYEKDMLPDSDEVEGFISDIDTLRNDAERVKQRIERLMKKTITDH